MTITASERASGGLVGAAGRAVQRLFSRPSAPLPALSPPSPEAARPLPREISGASLFTYAGADATAEAPAASWQEWQRWAARAPKGQRKERLEALQAYTAALLRREVGK